MKGTVKVKTIDICGDEFRQMIADGAFSDERECLMAGRLHDTAKALESALGKTPDAGDLVGVAFILGAMIQGSIREPMRGRFVSHVTNAITRTAFGLSFEDEVERMDT